MFDYDDFSQLEDLSRHQAVLPLSRRIGLGAPARCQTRVPGQRGVLWRQEVPRHRDTHASETWAALYRQDTQHYYCWQWCVAYVEPTEVDDTALFDAAWATLRDTCEAAGCAIAAGPDLGLAVVNAPEDVDLRALLEPLGLVGDALLLFQPDASRGRSLACAAHAPHCSRLQSGCPPCAHTNSMLDPRAHLRKKLRFHRGKNRSFSSTA